MIPVKNRCAVFSMSARSNCAQAGFLYQYVKLTARTRSVAVISEFWPCRDGARLIDPGKTVMPPRIPVASLRSAKITASYSRGPKLTDSECRLLTMPCAAAIRVGGILRPHRDPQTQAARNEQYDHRIAHLPWRSSEPSTRNLGRRRQTWRWDQCQSVPWWRPISWFRRPRRLTLCRR